MKIDLYREVALNRDVPEADLRQGDVATVVEHLPGTAAGGREIGYALEVFNAVGESLRVASVPRSAVAPLKPNEVPAVRPLTRTG